jgi:NACalpha-BTF3-like transcription factor
MANIALGYTTRKYDSYGSGMSFTSPGVPGITQLEFPREKFCSMNGTRLREPVIHGAEYHSGEKITYQLEQGYEQTIKYGSHGIPEMKRVDISKPKNASVKINTSIPLRQLLSQQKAEAKKHVLEMKQQIAKENERALKKDGFTEEDIAEMRKQQRMKDIKKALHNIGRDSEEDFEVEGQTQQRGVVGPFWLSGQDQYRSV